MVSKGGLLMGYRIFERQYGLFDIMAGLGNLFIGKHRANSSIPVLPSLV